MKTKIYAIFIMISILLLGVVNLVSAQPPELPSSFYGEILILDDAPKSGDIIEVYVGTVDSSPETTTTVLTNITDLVYAVNVLNNNYTTGTDVIFVIDERIVAIGKWSAGENQELEFHPPSITSPTAVSGTIDSPVSFSVVASDSGADIASYAWDWNNDETYDETNETNTASHTWDSTGDKTVILKVTDAQGGEDTSEITVTIDPISATVTITNLEQTYGNVTEPTVTTDPTGLNYTITYNGLTILPSNAGNYPVVVTITEAGYSGGRSGTLVINKANSTTTVTGGTFTYNGASHAATVSITGANSQDITPASPVITYSGACSAAPIYVAETPCTASYTFTGDDNHNGSTDSATITITQAEATVTLSNLNQVYNGTEKPVTVTTDPEGLNVSTIYNGEATAPTNPGSYAVVAEITDPNYTGSESGTLEISKATASITLDGLATTYDGTSKSVTATTTPSGKSVTITYNGESSAPTDADSYTIVATINDTYYQGTVTDTLVIAKASSTTTVSGGGSYEYDGLAHSATVSVTGAGGLNLTADPVYSCTTAPVNVTNTPCTTSYSYAGDNNHEGSSDSAIITITAKHASVTPNDASKVIDESDPTLTGSLRGFLSADNVIATYSRTSGETAGTYTISASLIPAGVLANYNITYNTAIFTIYARHSISLVEGWNLVSFNLIPINTNIESVLASVAGNYDLVYVWDAAMQDWLLYDPNVTISQDLGALDNTMGFWIYMTSVDTLDVVGTYPVASTNIILKTGWNLVGYPSDEGLTASNSDLDLIYAYHANDTDSWKIYDSSAPSYVNDLSTLQPGWGYWVYAAAPGTWQVTY